MAKEICEDCEKVFEGEPRIEREHSAKYLADKEILTCLLSAALPEAPVTDRCFLADWIAEYLLDHGVRVSEPAEGPGAEPLEVRGKRVEQLQDELNKARAESDALNCALNAKNQEINILCAQMDVVRMIFGGQ